MHGVLRFGPKQSSRARRKTPISFNQQDVCGMCNTQVSRYTCPKCNLHYCSLQCYRSPEHAECAESFDRSSLVNDIAAAPGQTQQQKQAMLDMLTRFESDSLDQDELDNTRGGYDELASKFKDVDLDAMSPQELLQLLSPEDQAAFHASVASTASAEKLIAAEVAPELPWWEVEQLDVPETTSADTDGFDSRHSSARPTLLKDAFTTSGASQENERHLIDLRYNLTALVIAYAFAIRTSGVKSFERSSDSAEDMVATIHLLADCVPFLFEHSTLKLDSVEQAVEYVASRAPTNTFAGSSLSTVIEDAAYLLQPDKVTVVTKSDHVCCLSRSLASLSDLQRLLHQEGTARGLKASPRLKRLEQLTMELALTAAARNADLNDANQQTQLNDSSLFKTKGGYINGQWTAGSANDEFTVYNPGTGQEIGRLPNMTVKDTKEAIEHAHTAFGSWKRTSEYERAAMLNKLFQLMKDNAEDLAQIITAENGKALTDARGEVTYGGKWFAGEAVRSYGDIIPASVPGLENRVYKQPVGVCGIITPWNFPNAMVTRKVGAALAAGCTVVMKAPAETPYSVLAIVELAERAGFPKGVVNCIVTESHVADVGKALCESPTVKKVSFTGSTRVGKILMSQSSSTLKKLSMELGGNAPFIVFDDANVDKAVAGAIACKFRLSGQTCVCANRIFVQDGIYDEFAAKLVEAVKKFEVGPGAEEGVTHGPVIHKAAQDKVDQHVQDAKSKGASVLLGGAKMDAPGYFYQPTVLGEVQHCAIDEDETFGPVAALYRFKTEEEVIARANEPDVGLAGYFFTENASRLNRVALALEVGMVGANTGLISQACAPFGGIGESGSGREGSKYGMAEYQNIKLVAQAV
ncbi:hypothetical protein OIV83_004093 [Microbotryomycetes sp. JL201]|nr:hypothetical protein OIV83_004093 [Microbotryomycetes sp. JL201]